MFYISGFYKFKKIINIKKNKKNLQNYFVNNSIRGTIILSQEGINGTISGKKKKLDLVINKIKKIFKFNNFDSLNSSKSKFQPFHRGKVKIKKEVVPMGIKVLKRKLINHVEPSKWNKLINDENTFLIDVRKPFEYDVGSFNGAVNPQVNNFREFPKYLKNLHKDKNIAMFCTGGIRCEKASAYMKMEGYKNVFQLKGGILKYLEDVPKKNSKWIGECFVFDKRVSVQNEMKPGTYELCHACRYPLSLDDTKSKDYKKGLSCPKCINKISNKKKLKLKERNKQIEIAKKRGIYNPYIKYTPSDFS